MTSDTMHQNVMDQCIHETWIPTNWFNLQNYFWGKEWYVSRNINKPKPTTWQPVWTTAIEAYKPSCRLIALKLFFISHMKVLRFIAWQSLLRLSFYLHVWIDIHLRSLNTIRMGSSWAMNMSTSSSLQKIVVSTSLMVMELNVSIDDKRKL